MKEKRPLVIAIDFDGTIVKHNYPNPLEEVPYALKWIKSFQYSGAKIILWTMRSSVHWNEEAKVAGRPEPLQEAVDYLLSAGVFLHGVNSNPDQSNWSTSPKAYANIYIDDAAAGCPLVLEDGAKRPYVDWTRIGPEVMDVIATQKYWNS